MASAKYVLGRPTQRIHDNALRLQDNIAPQVHTVCISALGLFAMSAGSGTDDRIVARIRIRPGTLPLSRAEQSDPGRPPIKRKTPAMVVSRSALVR
mgnify:FL=1